MGEAGENCDDACNNRECYAERMQDINAETIAKLAYIFNVQCDAFQRGGAAHHPGVLNENGQTTCVYHYPWDNAADVTCGANPGNTRKRFCFCKEPTSQP